MYLANEDEADGGPHGLSKDVETIGGMPAEFVRHLVRIAFDGYGGVTPDAQFQIDVRKHPERAKLLEQLIVEICPDGVDPVTWTKWLDGGKPPFMEAPKKPPLRKPTLATERPANMVGRTTARVAAQEDKVAQAEARLEQEKQHLASLKAHDNAALHFTVIHHLISMLSPVFAMGPAWTLMRSISAHASPAQIERATRVFLGKIKVRETEAYIARRAEESEELMDALDYFSGNEIVEDDIRAAVLEVLRRYNKHRDPDQKKGRAQARRSTEANPAATKNAAEILEGLRRADLDRTGRSN